MQGWRIRPVTDQSHHKRTLNMWASMQCRALQINVITLIAIIPLISSSSVLFLQCTLLISLLYFTPVRTRGPIVLLLLLRPLTLTLSQNDLYQQFRRIMHTRHFSRWGTICCYPQITFKPRSRHLAFNVRSLGNECVSFKFLWDVQLYRSISWKLLNAALFVTNFSVIFEIWWVSNSSNMNTNIPRTCGNVKNGPTIL